MKYIHYYEHIQSKPQIGDYVLIKTKHYKPEVEHFINNNIGQVFSMSQKGDDKYQIAFNVPLELRSDFWKKNRNSDNVKYTKWFNLKEIIFFSPSMEETKTSIQANKFNL